MEEVSVKAIRRAIAGLRANAGEQTWVIYVNVKDSYILPPSILGRPVVVWDGSNLPPVPEGLFYLSGLPVTDIVTACVEMFGEEYD